MVFKELMRQNSYNKKTMANNQDFKLLTEAIRLDVTFFFHFL